MLGQPVRGDVGTPGTPVLLNVKGLQGLPQQNAVLLQQNVVPPPPSAKEPQVPINKDAHVVKDQVKLFKKQSSATKEQKSSRQVNCKTGEVVEVVVYPKTPASLPKKTVKVLEDPTPSRSVLKEEPTPSRSALKEKLKDKLMRRSLSVEIKPSLIDDKLVSQTDEEMKVDQLRTRPKKMVPIDLGTKRTISDSRLLNEMLDEVIKHKICRVESAPENLGISKSEDKKELVKVEMSETAKVCIPVVMAQPMYNVTQINSYRMYQDSDSGDRLSQQLNLRGWPVAPAGKYKISKLKIALLGMQDLHKMSVHEKLKVMREFEERGKSEEEKEDLEEREAQNRLSADAVFTHLSLATLGYTHVILLPVTNLSRCTCRSETTKRFRCIQTGAHPLSTPTLLAYRRVFFCRCITQKTFRIPSIYSPTEHLLTNVF